MIIAQISDPHITAPHTDNPPAHGAAFHLQRAVAHLISLPVRPDVVLVTGDCVQHGSPAEYAHFQALLEPLTMPVYVVPGNHDNREVLQQVFGAQGSQPLAGFVQYVVGTGPVRLVALDTHVPQQDHGELCPARLAWLEARLAEAPSRPTLIFMHHPPFRTGLAVPDHIGFKNAEALGAIIARSPQAERIIAGHLHIAMVQRFHGTIAMTCAATDANLLPDTQQPERLVVRMGSPMCLLHMWHATAGLHTHTSVIGDQGPLITIHDGHQWVA